MKNTLVIFAILATLSQAAFAQNTGNAGKINPNLLGGDAIPSAHKNYLKLYLGFELAQRPVLDQSLLQGSEEAAYNLDYSTQAFYALAFARESSKGNFWEVSGQTNAYFGFQNVYRFEPWNDTMPLPPSELLGKERNSFAQLQYEYNWLLSNDNTKDVRPYLGLFMRAGGRWAAFQPSTSANFPREYWQAMLTPGFIPRLLIKGGRRWQIDLSAPITLGYFGLTGSLYENPTLTREQQRSTSLDMSMFNLETQVRLGVAYSLSRPPAE